MAYHSNEILQRLQQIKNYDLKLPERQSDFRMKGINLDRAELAVLGLK